LLESRTSTIGMSLKSQTGRPAGWLRLSGGRRNDDSGHESAAASSRRKRAPYKEEKLMTKPRRIGVEAMDGMTRKEVRITNAVANTLIGKHHVCQKCAIESAVAFVWANCRGRYQRTYPCSEACVDALEEFIVDLYGEGKEVRQSVLADIGREFTKLSVLEQRENVSERVKFDPRILSHG
jgi:superfamily II helicase